MYESRHKTDDETANRPDHQYHLSCRRRGNAGQANYVAAKAGVIGLTKTSAKELRKKDITVNAIAPGFISTDMTDKLSEDIQDEMLKQIPLARFGEPVDISSVVTFPCI